MTTPELPPLRPYATRTYSPSMKHPGRPTAYTAKTVEARERILQARIAELEADAERYRWLRNAISCRIVSHTTGELTSNYVEWYHLSAQFGAGSLDAAIDAAREAKP